MKGSNPSPTRAKPTPPPPPPNLVPVGQTRFVSYDMKAIARSYAERDAEVAFTKVAGVKHWDSFLKGFLAARGLA